MKRHLGRYLVTAAAGTGLLAYFLLASVGGKAGGALTPAWGEIADAPYDSSTAPDTISRWPETSKNVAGVMLDKYGQPNMISDESLVWFGHGSWKRTTVYRDGWRDQASVLHPEVLKQVITFRMPPERTGDVASFDTRLDVDSDRNELSFRSDSEKMNFLAINLAAEIAGGLKTVDEARTYALKVAQLSEAGKDTPYTKGFLFQVQNEFDSIPD